MHFANRRYHLLDCADILDHETIRQKSLIDQLHEAFISSLKANRSKMLIPDIHALALTLIHKSQRFESRPCGGAAKERGLIFFIKTVFPAKRMSERRV